MGWGETFVRGWKPLASFFFRIFMVQTRRINVNASGSTMHPVHVPLAETKVWFPSRAVNGSPIKDLSFNKLFKFKKFEMRRPSLHEPFHGAERSKRKEYQLSLHQRPLWGWVGCPIYFRGDSSPFSHVRGDIHVHIGLYNGLYLALHTLSFENENENPTAFCSPLQRSQLWD